MGGEDEGFAARWSKRKVAARQDDPAEVVTQDDSNIASLLELEDSNIVEASDDELLSEEDFDDVDFEALDKSSDYTRFARANVPEVIQKKALRKLWGSDPVFEVLDGMNDYDEDFTGNGLTGKVLKTAYKVGRGYLKEEDEPEKPADAEVTTAMNEEDEMDPAAEPKEESEQS